MFLRKIFLMTLAFMFAIIPSICAADIYENPRVAIIPFSKKAAVSADINFDDQINLTGVISDELFNTGRFDLLERESLSDITDEQMLQIQGIVNPATMVQVMNIEGAEYLLVGSIDGLSSKKRVGEALGIGSNSYTVVARLSARLINVETSRVELTGRSVAESTVRLTKAPLRLIRIGENQISEEQVSDALDKAGVKLIENMMINMDKMRNMR